MKFKYIIAAILMIPSLGLANDYSGDVPEGCYRTKWQSKVPLDTNLTCNAGNAVRSISFKHNSGENLTYQESYQLLCCKDQSLTNTCAWEEDFTSNEATSTEIYPTITSGLVTGIRFKHRAGENLTYQQDFRIKSCRTTTQNNENGNWYKGNKESLETEFSCYNKSISGMGFFHKNGENLTYQENVKVFCPSM
jgi:hypothetical protein